MKLVFTMKTPGIMEQLVSQYMMEWAPEFNDDGEDDYFSDIASEHYQEQDARAKIRNMLHKYFQYGECLKIEFDTETESFKILGR